MASMSDIMMAQANTSPQPSAQPTGQPLGGFAGVTDPNPLKEIAVPAANPQEVEKRKAGWQAVWDKVQNDPNLRQAMMVMGAQMAQPLQHGQTAAGNFGQSMLKGTAAYNAGEYSQYQREREMTEDQRKAAESKAKVEASTAETNRTKAQLPGVTAASEVATATVNAKIAEAKAKADKAKFDLTLARSEEEINKLERENKKRLEELKKNIPTEKYTASLEAGLSLPQAKLEQARAAIKASNAQAGAAGAAAAASRSKTGISDLTLETLQDLKKTNPKEFTDYLLKKGRYAATMSAVVQQREMWGQEWDELPAGDGRKKGKTRAQYQTERMTETKHQDAVTTYLKALQVGAEGPVLEELQKQAIATLSVRSAGSGTGAEAGGLSEKATAAWGSYEPERYEYRLNEQGVVERRTKTKSISR